MRWQARVAACYKIEFVIEFILSMLAIARVFFLSRSDTALEVIALRQQVAVLKRKRPRPVLNRLNSYTIPISVTDSVLATQRSSVSSIARNNLIRPRSMR